ncbi:translational GTPase TypA, partial [Escherichia coli]|nr:translational GTPase TypA [Escherichia coli]
FKVVYASALNGWASLEEGETGENMEPLFQTIVDVVDAPNVDLDGPLQMQVSQLDYSSYVGVIGVARVTRGSVKPNQQVTIIGADGKTRN